MSGGAIGADRLGERFVKEHGCEIKQFIPDWNKHKKSAGFKNNTEMIGYAEACIVFWDGESKGTKHTIDLAKKSGLSVKVVQY